MEELKVEQWEIGRLVPYARNPRRNDEVVERMVAAIREFGFRIPIIAKSDGTVVDGHLRLKAARKLGMYTVPVALADELSESQVKAFRLLANQSANWAEWDEDLLRFEFEDLKDADYDLAMTGFSDEEIEKMLAEVEDEPEAQEDTCEDDVPKEQEEAVSRKGDLWLMGSHRLLVGDSTDEAAYERLLGSRRASVVLASQSASHDFLRPALMRADGAVYIMTHSSEMAELKQSFKDAGGHWAAWIIAVHEPKPVGSSDYMHAYDAILYGWKKGKSRLWCGDEQGDLWEDSGKALCMRCIGNSSRKGDVVLDPFGGNGDSLMAADALGRSAMVLCAEPTKADVIVRRWQEATNGKATRETDGLEFDAIGTESDGFYDAGPEHIGDVVLR